MRRPPRKRKPLNPTIVVPIVVALIGFATGVTALISVRADETKARLDTIAELQPTIDNLLTSVPGEASGRQTAIAELQPTIDYLESVVTNLETAVSDVKPTVVFTSTPVIYTGQLEGIFTDRSGSPISNISVSIRNGSQTITDISGKFILENVPAGNQILVVKPPSGRGEVTQNVWVEANQTTVANIVYDVDASMLGLLSITAPVDGGILEVRKDGIEHRATIYGRSDGLAQVLGDFDIWVLISSERDGLFWVQNPPALVDPNANTWRANILLGSEEHPPEDGELWDIVAIAAESDSEIGRILNTPKLSLLPPHISSNVVTVASKIDR